MTKNHYRILVVVSLILLILSVKIDVIFNLLPDQYQIRLPNPLDGEMIILLGFTSLGVIASFYGYHGNGPFSTQFSADRSDGCHAGRIQQTEYQ